MLDITERKDAEQQLREAEETFRTIVEHNPAVIYTQEFDPNDPAVSRTTYVSPRQPEMLGYTVEEVIGDPTLWMRIIHPEDRERVLAADVESNAEQRDRFSLEYRMIAKDGRIVWVQDEATLVRVEGRAPFWQGFLLDITERKQAEEQLERALDGRARGHPVAPRARRHEEHVPAGGLARPADAARGDPRARDHPRAGRRPSARKRTPGPRATDRRRTRGASTASS